MSISGAGGAEGAEAEAGTTAAPPPPRPHCRLLPLPSPYLWMLNIRLCIIVRGVLGGTGLPEIPTPALGAGMTLPPVAPPAAAMSVVVVVATMQSPTTPRGLLPIAGRNLPLPLLRLSQTMLILCGGGIANPSKILLVPVCVTALAVPSLEELVISS